MRKLLSSLVIILIILLILWAAAGWYFGSKAEQEFKALLQESSQLAGKHFFRTELLSYQKTPSGAKARLEISSDYPVLSERLGDLELQVKLLNGPIFITRSGVSVGSSRWVLKIVDVTSKVIDGSNEEVEEVEGEGESKEYRNIFPNGLPSAVVRVDFEQKAHYMAKFGTSFAESLITGIFDLETQDNRGAITLKNLVLGMLPNTLTADNIQISYQHQKAITTRYKPGTASLQVSSLKVEHQKFSAPLVLDVKMNSNISLNQNALSGNLKSELRNVNIGKNTDDLPIETAELSVRFKGLPADAFIVFSEANDDLDNLHQQAQWALEELGEVPEGQDQIWLLYDRIEESSNALPKILADQIQSGDQPLIKLKATTHYKNTSSNLDGNIKLERDHPKLSSWLSLLDGEAKVELDDALFKMLQTFLPITNAKFKLILKDNKVLMAR